MCGILAAIDWQQKQDPKKTQHTLRQLLHIQRHRGPDGAHSWQSHDGRITFGHNRLSIIDLEHGWQPMIDAQSGCVLAYNGEIYNYLDLKDHLASRGQTFQTTSDSEVLLKGLVAYGYDFIHKLDGIFAFVFFNALKNEVYFARDHFGVKPLYYTHHAGILWIASELRTLAVLKDAEIDPQGFCEYLHLGYTLTPHTILKGILQLPHGSSVIYSQNQFLQTRYFDLAQSITTQQNAPSQMREVLERTDSFLKKSVKGQMISDVPVGVCLSGGVDSSVVAGLVGAISDRDRISAFTLDFSDPEYSEMVSAKASAEKFGLNHICFKFQDLSGLEDLIELAWRSDAPIFDNSFLATSQLFANISKHARVVLTGDGGDEVFLGYETYKASALYSMIGYPKLPSILRQFGKGLIPVKFGKVNLNFKLRKFIDKISAPIPKWCEGNRLAFAHYQWRELYSIGEFPHLLKPEWRCLFEDEYHPARSFIDAYQRTAHWHQPLTRLAYVDFESWLSNDILVKGDRASMAHGVEARVPLLDVETVRFAFSLPDSAKFSINRSKKILKDIKFQLGVNSSPPKKGFNSPVADWLTAHSKMIKSFFATPSSLDAFLNSKDCLDVLMHHVNKQEDHSFLIWSLLILRAWMIKLKEAQALFGKHERLTELNVPLQQSKSQL